MARPFGILTTITKDGSLWSRPISTAQANPNGEIWFFTKLNSPLANALEHRQHASLYYEKPADNTYVSILGICELVSDMKKAEELWDASYREWLAESPHDPSLILVRVAVERAEYWDSPSATWPDAGFSAPGPDRRDDRDVHAEIGLSNNEGPVVVRTGLFPSCHTNHARCYHRAFPTALGLGETPRHAAEDLLRRLHSQKGTVTDRWHLDRVEAAIAEVQAFLAEAFD